MHDVRDVTEDRLCGLKLELLHRYNVSGKLLSPLPTRTPHPVAVPLVLREKDFTESRQAKVKGIARLALSMARGTGQLVS